MSHAFENYAFEDDIVGFVRHPDGDHKSKVAVARDGSLIFEIKYVKNKGYLVCHFEEPHDFPFGKKYFRYCYLAERAILKKQAHAKHETLQWFNTMLKKSSWFKIKNILPKP